MLRTESGSDRSSVDSEPWLPSPIAPDRKLVKWKVTQMGGSRIPEIVTELFQRKKHQEVGKSTVSVFFK